MENIVLTIHLILAASLIIVVLLQRSEGGGLGIGGGGGGAASGRAPTTAVQKLTWMVAIGFLVTSISLTIISAQNSTGNSVIDRAGIEATDGTDTDVPGLPSPTGDLLPTLPTDAPAIPPAAD